MIIPKIIILLILHTGLYFERYYSNATPDIDPTKRIVNIEVWKSISVSTTNPNERKANAFIELPSLTKSEKYADTYRDNLAATGTEGNAETGRFLLLQPGDDYILHPETGYITFKTQIQDQDVIAVAYEVENGPGSADDSFIGEFLKNSNAATDTSQTLVLKLVKPKNLQPGGPYARAWKLLLKNIYPLGGRNIKQEGFEFNIEYEVEGQEPVTAFPTPQGSIKLLNAFGLDVNDAANSGNPDDIFDYRPSITIIPETGEVIFPTLEPFGNDLPTELPDSVKFSDVYDTLRTFAQQNKIKDKWLLTGKYSGEATSTYQLGFNIVENSVRVLLNGRELTPGVDYVVDYNIGQLTIRNDAALVPGADLKITYEQNDLFQLASKTFLGARGVFDFSKRTKLGFSILNLNQQTLSDKVRIGEEPLSNTIYGVDFSTGGDLPFLTRALDNVISTREMSSFSLSGEYAYINPDPNTKKSTISSDKGASIAYIDDFEGAKRTIPVGVNYTGWKDLSPPDRLPELPDTISNMSKMDYKGKSFWYTATPSNVNVRDIWGDRKKVAKADEQVTVMDYVFMPDTPGTYNYNSKLRDKAKSWGGIMKLLSSTASNLVEENVEYVEFWVNVAEAPQNAKLYLDLGRISEDVIPNGKLDSEDKEPRNDAIDQGEDTGIDGLTDDQERAKYGSQKADPSGDNFAFTNSANHNLIDYFNINGTEGNAVLTDIGRIPDTEDLNRNGSVDLVNSYFRYEIPLDTNRATNPYIAGGGDNAGWYLIRVPLKDTLTKVGQPSFTNVEFIRMFLNGDSSLVHLRFAEFNLVGSQWQKVLPQDSVMSVSVINVEDNPNYTSPPGVFQERDRSRPDENIYRNEQSLNLIIKDLPPGEGREAVKYLYKPLDVFNYKEMKLFIHGDEYTGPGSVSSSPSDTNSTIRSEVYFRFGGDTNNFYEYRQPVVSGWNEISIKFSELTAIKQARDSANVVVRVPVPGRPGHFYAVKGNPTLTSVKFLTVGINNITSSTSPENLSGEVWVNELRVVGADDSPGWAYSFASQLKMADLLTVNFNMSQTNPYFHKLSDRFGSRIEARNWSVSADLDVLKLLPFNMKESNLRLNYSHTESVGKPLYLPGTDIKVAEAAKLSLHKTADQVISETQSVNISDTWNISNIKLRIPTNFWLIRDTFNSLTFGFTYNKTFSRSPTILSNRAWQWNATANYALNLSPDNYFYPVNIPVLGTVVALFSDYRNAKVYYLPQIFSFNASARRNRNINTTRDYNNTPSTQTISRDFTTSRGFSFNWKITEGGLLNLSTNYNVNINSSLAYLETGANGLQRRESAIFHDIFSGVFFGKDYKYQQSLDFRTNPKLPTLWDINRFFNITAGYSASYQWNYDFRQEDLGRSAGFAAKSTVGLTLRWKALTQPLFQGDEENAEPTQQQGVRSGGGRGRRNFEQPNNNQANINLPPNDTTKLAVDSLASNDSTEIAQPKKMVLQNALKFFKKVARVLFFDYETISFNFSNDNSLTKSGIAGEGTGFKNFWGITNRSYNGPSRGFMLGLSADVGARAAKANLQDAYSQKNAFDFKTSRPLWEGAKIDLTWKVSWNVNKVTTLTSDDKGNVSISNISSTGTLNRSFFTLPPVLLFKVFNSGIKRVNELYDPNSDNPQESLSNAFVKGFESLPLLSRLGFLNDVAKYIPRPNWRISWDGLENFFLFKAFATRVSLDHAYTSGYSEGWKINPDGNKEVQTQKIDYAFSPLVGLNFTFGKLWGGNLISSVKYSVRSGYDLGTSTSNVTESYSKDIGITAGYSKSGFELPLFGISLKNDIEFSLSYTNQKTSTIVYNMTQFTESGTPQDGTTRVTLEPRVKYTISSKVTLSIFYRRSTVEPEGAARIPPTTTNEAGLDVHISIQ